jgi:hypothetical protein
MLNAMLFAGVIYKNVMDPDDSLARVRNGLELRRLRGFAIGRHEIELIVYGFADYFPGCAPAPGRRHAHESAAAGARILSGAQQQWRIRNVELPRLGIGIVSWHLDISSPF